MLNKLKIQLQPHQHLLAVSKFQSAEKIRLLHQEGQIDFGENYIQEALEKIELLKDLDLKWHLIGPIQSNKIKFIKKNFEYIHSVDSLKTAQRINEHAQNISHVQKVFLQINVSGEATKSGFSIEDFQQSIPELLTLKNLKIHGLMTMPPLQNQPEQNRPLFQKLKILADQYNFSELSMGTSHDYLIALQEGATWVRLGTVLFGERAK